MDPQEILIGTLAPAVVVGALLLILWGLGSSAARTDTAAPAAAASIAIGLATLVGFGLVFHWNFSPNESWRWLIWVFPLAGALGAIESHPTTTNALRWTLRLVLVAAATFLVLRKSLLPGGAHLDLQKTVFYIGAPLVLIGVWHATLPRLGAVLGAATLWMLAVGMAGMFVLAAHSINFAQICGSIAGGLGALIVACWLRPSAAGMAGAITPVAIILSAQVFLSFELAEFTTSRWTFGLVALAPVLGLTPIARKPWTRFALMSLPVAVAVGIAFHNYDTSVL